MSRYVASLSLLSQLARHDRALQARTPTVGRRTIDVSRGRNASMSLETGSMLLAVICISRAATGSGDQDLVIERSWSGCEA